MLRLPLPSYARPAVWWQGRHPAGGRARARDAATPDGARLRLAARAVSIALPPGGPTDQARRRRVALGLAAGCAVVMAGCAARDDGGAGAIVVAGTVELTEVDVAPLAAARVVRVLVDEGATVRAGDTLAVLATPQQAATLAGGAARVAARTAERDELREGARAAERARARAELAAAEAEAARTAGDAARLLPLAARGTVSAQQRDAARAAADAARARRDAARAALALVDEGARATRRRAADAALAGARADAAAVEAQAADLVLRAPVAGRVLVRAAEPGEVLAAGVPAVTLGDPARAWVRVYVGASALPRLRVGDAATVTAAGLPAPRRARVVAVRGEAEFTPRVALTEAERADLVFAVRVALAPGEAPLPPGLPVTVTIAPGAAR